jgi:hypothetical protein
MYFKEIVGYVYGKNVGGKHSGDYKEIWWSGIKKLPSDGPSHVTGNYWVNNNALKDLVGAPSVVDGDFNAHINKLTSFKGIENTVIKGGLEVSVNNIKNLKGLPKKIGKGISLSENPLTSLKGLPSTVNGDLELIGTKIKSLEGTPKIVNGSFLAMDCKSLKSLKGIPKVIKGHFYIEGAPIKVTEEEVRALCKVGGRVETVWPKRGLFPDAMRGSTRGGASTM